MSAPRANSTNEQPIMSCGSVIEAEVWNAAFIFPFWGRGARRQDAHIPI
jgi:hypothetical protein